MTPQKINSFSLKGFVVPQGYELIINTDNGQITHQEGEQSGSAYTFEEIIGGEIDNWTLHRLDYGKIEVDQELRNILQSIKKAGGQPLFVGGVVRDKILGVESKDIDVEVYGLDTDALTNVLSDFGSVDIVGASFGVIKLTTPNQDYDFSFPRRESKQGQGHRGFIVEADPSMSPEEASTRRDYTINALAMTPGGELLDFFNGVKHLKEGILRHTANTFSDDPLRVLRGFQLAGRFNLKMDPDTAKLAKELRREFTTLSKDRIWGEFFKWATKSTKPSAGLEVLETSGWLELFPQLNVLRGITQDLIWHPEGDVWTHTKYVTDAAAEIAEREGLDDKSRAILLFGALCHDLGKPTTTVIIDDKRTSPGHAKAGIEPTKEFLSSIGAPKDVIAKVVPLVKEHMMYNDQVSPRSVRRLALRLVPTTIEMLSMVMEADNSGRPPLPKGMPKAVQNALMMAHQLRVQDDVPQPIIGGSDLMRLANENVLPPEYTRGGPHFGQLLTILFDAQLDGEFDTHDDGIDYLKSLFIDPETSSVYSTLNFLITLSASDKEKLVESANDKGLTEIEVIKLPLNKIKQMLE